MKEAKEQDINFADILWIFEALNFLLIDRWSFSSKEETFLMVEKARKTQFDRKDWNILKEKKLKLLEFDRWYLPAADALQRVWFCL